MTPALEHWMRCYWPVGSAVARGRFVAVALAMPTHDPEARPHA